jgi:hypothetical protein
MDIDDVNTQIMPPRPNLLLLLSADTKGHFETT